MVEKVKSSLKRLTAKGDTVAVAVSGGADSIALLNILWDNRGELGLNVLVINVEHGIRGAESLRDSGFVRNFCGERGIPFIGRSADVPSLARESSLSIEECARQCRYDIFWSLINQKKCDKIALGHHADDQAETVFMRIARGSGVGGLKGMETVRDGVFIRPLLDVTRSEIEQYLRENTLRYVEDSTNADSGYTRNFIRNEIFPLIETRYPSFKQALIRLSKNAAAADSYIKRHAEELLTERDGAVCVPTTALDNAAEAKAVIDQAFARLGVLKDIESRHLDELKKLSLSKNGEAVDMPFGIRAANEYGYIAFYREEPYGTSYSGFIFEETEKCDSCYKSDHQKTSVLLSNIIKEQGSFDSFLFQKTEKTADFILNSVKTVQNSEITAQKTTATARDCAAITEFSNTSPTRFSRETLSAKSDENSSGRALGAAECGFRTLYADAAKIPKDAVIRYAKSGDIFKKFGGGTKKLCDYMTDIKRPKRLRGSIPVVAVGNEVLIVAGIEIAESVRVTPRTLDIYEISRAEEV